MDLSIPFCFNFEVMSTQNTCCDILSCFANCVTAFVTIVALVFTYKEYLNHIKRERANVLSRFNERYSDDASIKRVVSHINAIAYNINISSETQKTPDVYDIEMFMRFFEELEYSIQSDNLDKRMVRDLFGFYPLLAIERKDFLFKDDEKENWRTFILFVKRMKQIKPLSNADKGNFPLQ